MKLFLYISIAVCITSCNKEKYYGGPNSYTDDFESYIHIDSTLDGENVNWSFFQNTVEGNGAVIDTAITHSGNQSVHFFASPSTENMVSKSSIVKQKMAFYEGDILYAEMWYYIDHSENAEWLFLFDLEENAVIGAGPGMRLAIENDQLLVEHKYYETDVRQAAGSELKIPRKTWFKISFETLLSQKDEGYVKLWQNDTLIIHETHHRTLPKDGLYFQQGTKAMYTNIEFGITANTHSALSSPMHVYLDDVSVKVLN